MEGLKGLDDVAYVRFASVYKNFREAKDFEELLGELVERREPARGAAAGRGGRPGPPREAAARAAADAPPRPAPPTTSASCASRSRSATATSAGPGRTRPSAPSSSISGAVASSSPRARREPAAGPTPSAWRSTPPAPAARGATLYVTLEPCAHHGRTPPCADAIVAAGIARVVGALDDPDPRVGGLGYARLRAAGIAVTAGRAGATRRRAPIAATSCG